MEECGGVNCEPSLGKYILILARSPKSDDRTSRAGTGVIFPTVYLRIQPNFFNQTFILNKIPNGINFDLTRNIMEFMALKNEVKRESF